MDDVKIYIKMTQMLRVPRSEKEIPLCMKTVATRPYLYISYNITMTNRNHAQDE